MNARKLSKSDFVRDRGVWRLKTSREVLIREKEENNRMLDNVLSIGLPIIAFLFYFIYVLLFYS